LRLGLGLGRLGFRVRVAWSYGIVLSYLVVCCVVLCCLVLCCVVLSCLSCGVFSCVFLSRLALLACAVLFSVLFVLTAFALSLNRNSVCVGMSATVRALVWPSANEKTSLLYGENVTTTNVEKTSDVVPRTHWSSVLPAISFGMTSIAIVIPVLPDLKLKYFNGDYSLLSTWQSRYDF
jgi:hypothetical protein